MRRSWCYLVIVTAAVAGLEPEPCPRSLTVDIANGTTLANGSIVWDGLTFDRDKFFAAVGADGAREVRGCVCQLRRCFRKCCPWGKAYTNSSGCNPSSHALVRDFRVPVHDRMEEVDVPDGHFHVITDNFCEFGAYQLQRDQYEEDEHYLQKDGRLYQNSSESWHRQDRFCIEVFETLDDLSALICFEGEEESTNIYSIGMMISLPFLLVTFMVYAFIPELRNLHGKCLMCYVMSLFVAYVFLISIQLGRAVISNTFCVVAPFIIYFGFMVSFLWLNVMCIDIWWTFSGRRGFIGSARQSERRRFLVYSAYAWGIAMAMVAITAAMQFADVPVGWIKPEFGVGKCWFAQEKATGLYFYGPIMLVILSNLLLFGWTTMKIYQVKKETERSMRNDSQRHGDESDKQRFKLYMKLMLVFGVNWSMEIISWLAGGPNFLWYVTDLCNALYGVLIFFIFVCKANVWKLTKKRYECFFKYIVMGKQWTDSTAVT